MFDVLIRGGKLIDATGAAGFWGGLPFWVICFMVLPLVFYDFWDSCLRKKK